ncbi:NAD-dependent epimerase/dehydratase family protein [Caldiplasma sukawensis]
MSETLRYLITGGLGFIGSNMAQILAENNEVTILDNYSNGSEINVKKIIDNINLVKGDITRLGDFEKIGKNDVVIHLAANSDVRKGSLDRDSDVNINVIGTKNVLEYMVREGVPEMMFSSTSTVYGEAKQIPTEENYGPLLPISLYGATKLADEGLIWAYHHYFNIKVSIFRFANIIGRHSTHGVIHDFISKLRKNSKELEILGDGKQEKSYMHVDDCTGAILHIGNKIKEGDVVNLGNEQRTSVKRIADIVIESMGLNDVNIVYNKKYGGRGWPGDVTIAQLSVKKMNSYGWHNKYTSDEAVKKSVEEILNNEE